MTVFYTKTPFNKGRLKIANFGLEL